MKRGSCGERSHSSTDPQKDVSRPARRPHRHIGAWAHRRAFDSAAGIPCRAGRRGHGISLWGG